MEHGVGPEALVPAPVRRSKSPTTIITPVTHPSPDLQINLIVSIMPQLLIIRAQVGAVTASAVFSFSPEVPTPILH